MTDKNVRVLPPESGRLQEYKRSNFWPSKYLFPDGSVWSSAPSTVESSVVPGFNIPPYDTVQVSYNDPSFTEIYTYKLSGSVVAVITVVYSDATKDKLVSVTRS